MRIIHLLEMNYMEVTSLVPQLAKRGFEGIQVGSCCPTKGSLYPNLLNILNGYGAKRNRYSDWWKLYQPMEFTIGNELGNKYTLTCLCKQAEKYGIKIIMDIVFRHLANGDYGSPYEPNQNADKDLISRPECFLEKREMDSRDRHSAIWHCSGLPSLNYTNDLVVSKYRTFLQSLMECGVRGLRLDMGTKHFALPSEGGSNFWNLINEFKNRYNLFVYSEAIECGDDILNNFIRETGILVLTDYTNYWDKDMTVGFRYSHDMALTWDTDVNNNNVVVGYCDLCKTHKNTLFYTVDYQGWDCDEVEQSNRYYK